MREMYEQLENGLTVKEVEQLAAAIQSAKKPFTSLAELDMLLGRIKNMETSFFQDNQSLDAPLTELYFFINKPVVVKENIEVEGIVYYIGEHYYFPFEKLIPEFGYSFKKITDSDIYVYNRFNHYRFYIGKDFLSK